MSPESPTLPMDAAAIRAILPHRYPFLMIDRVIEFKPDESITAIKCVSQIEPYFQGHFPDYPVMPGVLQIEAVAQAGAIYLTLMGAIGPGQMAILTTVEEAKFRSPVGPGDVLRIHAYEFRLRRGYGKARGTVMVNDQVCSEGVVGFAVVNR